MDDLDCPAVCLGLRVCVRARACVSMVLDFMIGSPPFYTGLMGSNRGA